ncbi:hypothetical protein BDV19DRAFT_196442 [Aspergillus venezuelensis]
MHSVHLQPQSYRQRCPWLWRLMKEDRVVEARRRISLCILENLQRRLDPGLTYDFLSIVLSEFLPFYNVFMALASDCLSDVFLCSLSLLGALDMEYSSGIVFGRA